MKWLIRLVNRFWIRKFPQLHLSRGIVAIILKLKSEIQNPKFGDGHETQKLLNPRSKIPNPKFFICIGLVLMVTLAFPMEAKAQPEQEDTPQVTPIAQTEDLEISSAKVSYLADLDLFVFQQQVNGVVGKTLPEAKGKLDGAPVLGYIFPTTLNPADVGFGATGGMVALAVTSHPDFDDTPMRDENNDSNYDNDGQVLHSHWVVLVRDERVPGKLSVKETQLDVSGVLPPTSSEMPIYLDSPSLAVITDQDTLKVLVPAPRVSQKKNFNFDAITAYMEVNTSSSDKPMLGVHKVYSVCSGDLSLPYTVEKK